VPHLRDGFIVDKVGHRATRDSLCLLLLLGNPRLQPWASQQTPRSGHRSAEGWSEVRSPEQSRGGLNIAVAFVRITYGPSSPPNLSKNQQNRMSSPSRRKIITQKSINT
jgi:hypothetical protein